MAIAGVVTYLATFVVRRLADRYKIYPKVIRSRDMHSKPTPRIGGLAMFIGFVVSVAIAAPIGLKLFLQTQGQLLLFPLPL
jgi:UDP-GlcNAc:undecaprenyl-phosphate GlcNAc-1-phosphate transferase